jgi:hypothetical protein
MAFLMLLRRMHRGDLTTHGFSSSFRDWAAERTNFSSKVAVSATVPFSQRRDTWHQVQTDASVTIRPLMLALAQRDI